MGCPHLNYVLKDKEASGKRRAFHKGGMLWAMTWTWNSAAHSGA